MKFIDYANIPLLSDTWNDYKLSTYIETACHLKRNKMVLKHGKVNTTTWNDRGSHRLWERNELGNGKTWARCFLDWIFAKILSVLKPRKPDADHPVTDQFSLKKNAAPNFLYGYFLSLGDSFMARDQARFRQKCFKIIFFTLQFVSNS